MALHSLQDATLGGIEGKGYAFTKRTSSGEEIQGVFFGSEEDGSDLEDLLEKEQVRFKGIAYYKRRSGDFSERMKTFLVDVKDLRRVGAGERAMFEVVAEV